MENGASWLRKWESQRNQNGEIHLSLLLQLVEKHCFGASSVWPWGGRSPQATLASPMRSQCRASCPLCLSSPTCSMAINKNTPALQGLSERLRHYDLCKAIWIFDGGLESSGHLASILFLPFPILQCPFWSEATRTVRSIANALPLMPLWYPDKLHLFAGRLRTQLLQVQHANCTCGGCRLQRLIWKDVSNRAARECGAWQMLLDSQLPSAPGNISWMTGAGVQQLPGSPHAGKPW